jgi:hypothetical protein
MARPKDFNSKIIAEFRANGGTVGGPFGGSDILLLHHIGAHTGTRASQPARLPTDRPAGLCQQESRELRGLRVEGGGAAEPGLVSQPAPHPDRSVEVGTETFGVRARLAEPAERDVIWSRQKQRAPHFAQYEEKAAPRKIPVVVLDPVK